MRRTLPRTMDIAESSFKPTPFAGTARSNGFTIVELIATMTLLGIAMLTMAPLLGWSANERANAIKQQMALQEACNILERFSVESWENINLDSAAALTVSEECQRALKQPQLTVTVTNEDEDIPAKRIALQLFWKNRAGDMQAPIRLTTWVFQQTEVE